MQEGDIKRGKGGTKRDFYLHSSLAGASSPDPLPVTGSAGRSTQIFLLRLTLLWITLGGKALKEIRLSGRVLIQDVRESREVPTGRKGQKTMGRHNKKVLSVSQGESLQKSVNCQYLEPELLVSRTMKNT